MSVKTGSQIRYLVSFIHLTNISERDSYESGTILGLKDTELTRQEQEVYIPEYVRVRVYTHVHARNSCML